MATLKKLDHGKIRVIYLIIHFLAALLLISACGSSGGKRTEEPPVPLTDSLAFLPESINLSGFGQTTQLSLTFNHSDGSTSDVTNADSGTVYIMDNPGIVTVTADGLITAIGSGDMVIKAHNSGLSVDIPIKVTIASAPVSASAQTAYDALNSQSGDHARIRWNQKNGLPSLLYNQSGYLSGESSLSAEDILFKFLSDYEDLYQLSPDERDNFITKNNFTSQHNQVRHLVLEQYSRDIPVWNSRLQSSINKQGKIISITGDYYPGIDIPVTPSLTANEALSAAVRIFEPLKTDFQPVLLTGPDGSDMACTFDPDIYYDNHQASLVIFPYGNTFRLCWKVIFRQKVSQIYIVMIDAQSGSCLFQSNAVVAYTSSQTGGLVFEDNPDTGSQVWRSFNGDPQASPDGWITENLLTELYQGQVQVPFTTLGNNVWAAGTHETVFRFLARHLPLPTNQSDFSIPFQNAYEDSQGTDVETDWNAGIINTFYWGNVIHDHYYHLGFDEAAGNFQNDNFSRGGLGEDQVRAYVQYGWDDPECRNNAFFSTTPEGVAGSRMSFLLYTSPPYRYADSAFSADIIIHEYTHGLSNRLCGGPNNYTGEDLTSVQSSAMSEGWSDWFAANMLDNPVHGTYTSDNPTTGGRFHALDNNPLTYSDIGYIGFTERHIDGEIWSATLWDLREAFIDSYGQAEGKHRVEQLVVDAMKLSPAEPSFLDFRDFILLMDSENYGGVDTGLIWEVFAARGMGFSAQTNGPNDADPAEAFDLPAGSLSSISIDQVNVALNDIGETRQLSVTGHFSNGSEQDVTAAVSGTLYVSSNPAIATVSGDGLVTAVASGSTTITATNSGNTDTCVVAVSMLVDAFILLGEDTTAVNTRTLALYGDYAYLGDQDRLSVVDIQDPSNPSVQETFGEGTIDIYVRCRMVGDTLAVGSGSANLALYTLTNPEQPQLLAEENTGYNLLTGGFAWGDYLYLNTNLFGFYVSSNTIVFVRGDVVPFNLSTPSSPVQLDALYNTPQSQNPEWPGSNYWVGQGCAAGSGIALIPSTTGEADATSGTGSIDVVNISNPANLTVLDTLIIPDTRVLTSVSVNGTQALAVGSDLGFIMENGSPKLPGNLVMTTLDISDPQNPIILGSRNTSIQTSTRAYAESGIANCYTVSGLINGVNGALSFVDTRDPFNPDLYSLDVDYFVQESAIQGTYLYAVGQNGLKIYNIGGIFARPHNCSTLLNMNPDIGVKAYLEATQNQMVFEYSSGSDASTDVSFQLYLNGTYIADVDSVSPGETSGEIILPDNLVSVGGNTLELKNPRCTIGYGSCIDGSFDSLGGSVCVNSRDTSLEATWFEQTTPNLDYTLTFPAEDTLTTMTFIPGPRWCTTVSFELYLNGNFVRLLTITPDDPGFDLPLTTIVGSNTLEFRDPTCSGTIGCCEDGQLTSWGGMVHIW